MRHSRLCLLLGLAAPCAAFAAGCGSSNATGAVAPPPDTLRAVDADLRFKGVGRLSGLPHGITSAVVGRLGFITTRSSGSPLSIGEGVCTPNDPLSGCGWEFTTYPLAPSDTGLTVQYRGDSWSDLGDSFEDTVSSDTVVTSLDLEPADSLFAYSAYIASVDGGYLLTKSTVAPSGLQAAASAEAAQRRVITALSFVNGDVEYLAYGWQHDTNTAGYDVHVSAVASIGDVPTAAQSLANAGYTITAFGGDSTDGFALVGTRVGGATAARTLQVVPNSRAGIVGFATVAFLFDPVNGFTVIGEK